MKKYADVESVRVLSDQEQARIADVIQKVGKVSASELTDEERRLLKSE